MPRCRVTRRVHFNAAHRLHNPDASEAWNQATFGECNNPNFHGHNYELDLSVEGEIDPRHGLRHGPEPPEGAGPGAAAPAPGSQEPESGRALVPGPDPDVREHRPGLLAGAARRAARRSSRFVSACGRRRGTMSTTKGTRTARRCGRPERTTQPDRRARQEPFAEKVREMLAALGEDPEREGLVKTPERVEASLRFLTQGYHMSVAEVDRRRGLRGDPPEHDHGARHRALLALRAPPAAVLRPGPRRLHPERQDPGALQGGPDRGRLRPAAAGAGAAHRPDRRRHHGRARAHRRGRRHRGGPLLHDDARGGEAELPHGHQRPARHLPRRLEDPGRVPPAGARGAAPPSDGPRRPRRAGDGRVPRDRRRRRRRRCGRRGARGARRARRCQAGRTGFLDLPGGPDRPGPGGGAGRRVRRGRAARPTSW